MHESLFIKWRDEFLATSIDYPLEMKSDRKYPLMIICHGFIGSKVGVDRLFVKAAKEFIQDQYIVLRFDFAGCGESSGQYGATGLHDLIDQTQTVIDFALSDLEQADETRVTLLGHSLGGATAVLTAAGDKRIDRLILWASVGQPYKDLKRIVGNEKVNSLDQDLETEYSGYYFKKSFFDSLIGYEPLKATSAFSGDVLIVHGTGDEDIPVHYAREYELAFNKRLTGTCEKHEIDDANHTISNGKHFSELLSVTREWVQRQQKNYAVNF